MYIYIHTHMLYVCKYACTYTYYTHACIYAYMAFMYMYSCMYIYKNASKSHDESFHTFKLMAFLKIMPG